MTQHMMPTKGSFLFDLICAGVQDCRCPQRCRQRRLFLFDLLSPDTNLHAAMTDGGHVLELDIMSIISIYILILEGTAPYWFLLLAPAEGWWLSAFLDPHNFF